MNSSFHSVLPQFARLAPATGHLPPTRVNQPHAEQPRTGRDLSSTLSCCILEKLTPAERRVALHVLQGWSNKEIANRFGRAEATVKHQIACVLKKVGAPSRGRFVALYYAQFICILPDADWEWDVPTGIGGSRPTAAHERRRLVGPAVVRLG